MLNIRQPRLKVFVSDEYYWTFCFLIRMYTYRLELPTALNGATTYDDAPLTQTSPTPRVTGLLVQKLNRNFGKLFGY